MASVSKYGCFFFLYVDLILLNLRICRILGFLYRHLSSVNKTNFVSFLFFFWPHPQHVEIPGLGIKPEPQQRPELPQGQLCHKTTPVSSFLTLMFVCLSSLFPSYLPFLLPSFPSFMHWLKPRHCVEEKL